MKAKASEETRARADENKMSGGKQRLWPVAILPSPKMTNEWCWLRRIESAILPLSAEPRCGISNGTQEHNRQLNHMPRESTGWMRCITTLPRCVFLSCRRET
jgi:hypothetical protein